MRSLRLVVLAGAVVWADPAAGDSGGSIELGIDAGFNVSLLDDSEQELFSIGVPSPDFSLMLQNFRVGFAAGSRGLVEPSFGFSALDDGESTFWRLGLGLDYLRFLTAPACVSRPFLRAGGVLNVVGSGPERDVQLGASAGSGYRLEAGEIWGVRLEGGIARMFPMSGVKGRWDIVGTVGLSFFLR